MRPWSIIWATKAVNSVHRSGRKAGSVVSIKGLLVPSIVGLKAKGPGSRPAKGLVRSRDEGEDQADQELLHVCILGEPGSRISIKGSESESLEWSCSART